MHRLERPTEPAAFMEAVAELLQDYPPASNRTVPSTVEEGISGSLPAQRRTENERWEALRNTRQDAWLAARDALEHNQNGICAYCEIKLRDNNRQIEHFRPKCLTTVSNDLTYAFSNMLMSCIGGTNRHSRQPGEFSECPSARANHSCGEKKGDTDPNNVCLNPYELPTFPIVRPVLNDNGISFAPDETACRSASIDPALVQSTLDFLNLNCPRLNERRKAVWDTLGDEITYAQSLPQSQQLDEFASIADTYLRSDPVFYTTKLLCLADAMPNLIP